MTSFIAVVSGEGVKLPLLCVLGSGEGGSGVWYPLFFGGAGDGARLGLYATRCGGGGGGGESTTSSGSYSYGAGDGLRLWVLSCIW